MGVCITTNFTQYRSSDRKIKIVEEGHPVPGQNAKDKQHTILASKLATPSPKLRKIPKTKIALETNQKEVELTLYNLRKIIVDNSALFAKYEDKEFRPIIHSLIPPDETNPLYSKVTTEQVKEFSEYKWLRCNEIYGVNNYKLILSSALLPEDIIQGKLRNGYFLAALASLVSNHYEKFKKIFEISEVKEKGIYAIRFFIQGIPKIVLIDDLIPCKIAGENLKNDFKYVPVFSRSRDREICIMLLEKAWAKVNSKCYLKTCSGTPQEMFHALCEAPCTLEFHEYFFRQNKLDHLWQLLRESEKNKWMLTTVTENYDNIELMLGLPPCHSFSVLGVYEINTLPDNKNKAEVEDREEYLIKLIKLRNPTGQEMMNFQGEFCDTSRKWTREYKKETMFENKKKGTFYVTFEEYHHYFHWTFVCRYFPDYVYNYGLFWLFGDRRVARKTSTMLFRKSTKALLKNDTTRKKTVSWLDYDCETMNNIKSQTGSRCFDNNTRLKTCGTLNVSINFDKINSRVKCIQVSPPLLKASHEEIHSSSEEEENENENATNITNIYNHPRTQIAEKVKTPYISHEDHQHADIKVNSDTMQKFPKGSSKIKLIESFNYDIFPHLIFITLEITTKTRCFFCLHQPQLRFAEDDPDYQIPMAFFIVARYIPSTQGYTYIGSDIGNIEKLFIDAQLLPGEYHIFANSYWTSATPLQLVVSTYSEQPVLMHQYPIEELAPNWIEAILVDIAKKNPRKEMIYNQNNSECFSSIVQCDGSNYTGFGIFYYENNSARESLEVNLLIKKCLGVKFLNCENPEDSGDIALEYRISVPPKNYRCLIYQIISLPWLMQLEWDQHVWFDLPYETVVKRYLNSPKTKVKTIDNEEGVALYEIAYDNGFLVMIDNLSECRYKWRLTFMELNGLKIESGIEDELIEFISEPKLPYFIRITGEGKKVGANFNLIYNFDLERLLY